MPPKPHKRAALYLAGAEDADMRRVILADEAKGRLERASLSGSGPELGPGQGSRDTLLTAHQCAAG
jgi:hypothetical protein